MSPGALNEFFRKRRHRRAYRAIVKEWYADGGDSAMRFDFDLDRNSLVFDLGSYEGQWANERPLLPVSLQGARL